MDKPECLNRGDGKCEGPVEYHGFGGKAFPRCDKHWADRVRIEQQINQRYPRHAPADFDPGYAGERWDDD